LHRILKLFDLLCANYGLDRPSAIIVRSAINPSSVK